MPTQEDDDEEEEIPYEKGVQKITYQIIILLLQRIRRHIKGVTELISLNAVKTKQNS